MPFAPDQVTLLRDEDGKTVGLKGTADHRLMRAATISNRSDLLRAFSRGLHSGDPRFSNNEVFNTLRTSLQAAVSNADDHLFDGGLAESKRSLEGKEIYVNE